MYLNKDDCDITTKLAADIRQAFETWHKPAAENPLRYLRLFWVAQRSGGDAGRTMLQQRLLEALDELEAIDAPRAKLMRLRFLERKPLKEVKRILNIAQAEIFRSRDKAIKQLAKIICCQETQAQTEYQTVIETRLAKRTYDRLFGIDQHLDTLLTSLESPKDPWLILLHGIGGIGKTALADALIRRLMHDYSFDDLGWISAQQRRLSADGQIIKVNAPALTSDDLVAALAIQLLPETNLPSRPFTPEQILPILKQHLQQFRALIVLDNLETLDDLAELLPTLQELANPSKFLLTTREPLNHAGLHAINVSQLCEAATLELIRHEVRRWSIPDASIVEDAQLASIFRIVGGNPLALRLFVGQMRIFEVNVILENLRAAAGRDVKTLYQFIFAQAWETLNDVTRRLLIAMPLTPEAGGSFETLLAISDLTRTDLVDALAQLAPLNLVDRQRHFYTIHNLTRTYLLAKVRQQESNFAALFDQYTIRSVAHALVRIKSSGEESLPEIEQRFALHVLAFGLPLSSAWPATYHLLMALVPHLEKAGWRDEWLAYLEQGIAQSQQMNDVLAEAELRYQAGFLHQLRARYDQSRHHLEASIALFAAQHNSGGQAQSLNRLAYVMYLQRDYESAIELANHASALLSEDDLERSFSEFILGLITLAQNKPEAALSQLESSLARCRQAGDLRKIAQRLLSLGMAWRALGDYSQAIAAYEEAIALFGQVGDLVQQAIASMNLANIHLLQGNQVAALKLYELAEPPLHRTADEMHLAMLATNRGIALRDLQRWQEAQASLQEGVSRWECLGNVAMQVGSLDELGLVFLRQDRFDQASAISEEALALLARIQRDPSYPLLFESVTKKRNEAQCGLTGTAE